MPRKLPTKHVHVDWFWLGREPWRPHAEEVKSARLRATREALRIEEIHRYPDTDEVCMSLPDSLPDIGQPIDSVPLTFVRSIEEYEGPLLTEFCDDYGVPYLEKWCTCSHEQKTTRSLVVKSTPRAIEEYLAGQLSMLDLLTHPNQNVGMLVDTKFRTGEVVRSALVDIRTIPPEYMPDPTAMYDETLDPQWR